MNEDCRDYKRENYGWSSSTKWEAIPIFACMYCHSDIMDDGIIKRGKIFCDTDCAIKYSLQEAK